MLLVLEWCCSILALALALREFTTTTVVLELMLGVALDAYVVLVVDECISCLWMTARLEGEQAA